MKNKFEALKAFMSWPREWQELCAEFWASDDEPDQQRFKAADLAIAPRPNMSIEPKRKLERWSIAQQEHLVECMNQCGSQKHAAEMFLKRYPGRKPGAVKIKIYNMTDANGVMHVRY